MKNKGNSNALNTLKIKNISYYNHTKILDTEEGKYAIKVKKKDKEELFNYLKSKNFNYCLPLENSTKDPFEIYRFIKENHLSAQEKGASLVYVLSMLHIKTTTYQEINLDNVKKVYEETIEKLNYLNNYYLDLQDYIETKIYMSPAEYLLMRNISKIYSALNFSRNILEKWYEEEIVSKKERQVLLHNNLTLDHFLNGEELYLINWNNSKRGLVIYDFLNFYKNEYLYLEMESLFDIYKSKYQYTHTEFLLFLSLISIPPKVEFTKTNYINTLEVKRLIIYLEKTNHFISKEYKENKKTD